ncbi:twin-arginine translocation signal domain-containing protein [Hoeflea sp. YIM 152468]|uniref:twin-arginine translocation signal domain-containing protein n=1 Tax=Hoeflea sp. YIM 152468 TaxID=3031759 RepID=UPI0023DB00F6|nr:twin-arginine translocation signal domain-containing protein [Hoeflea sp. YIM 152468]MDF1606848.1 twin-arginine translocation signal domain-containing protein [Hoeflea sp. YIM 152468]
MKAKTEDTTTDRRGFLKFAGLGTIASGAALVAGTESEAAEVAELQAGTGYRETDHIKAYYASTRF